MWVRKSFFMNRLDCIEKTLFLGREFLLWLWFASETNGGIVGLPDDRSVEIILDDRIVLEPIHGQGNRHLLMGLEPSHTPEAAFALQRNKLPSEIKLKIILASRAWSFMMRWDDLLLRSLRIPEVLSGEDDDHLYERIYLLEEIEGIMDALWIVFLQQRLSSVWKGTQSALQEWISTKSTDEN